MSGGLETLLCVCVCVCVPVCETLLCDETLLKGMCSVSIMRRSVLLSTSNILALGKVPPTPHTHTHTHLQPTQFVHNGWRAVAALGRRKRN